MKKKILTAILSLSLIFSAVPAYAQVIEDSSVIVYTYSMPFDTKLKSVDKQLYISARDAATMLGAEISWNDATKTAVIYEANHTLVFTIDKSGYYNNSIQMFSVNKPVIINGKCYVSLIDVLTGARKQYKFSADGSINVLTPVNIDANNREILTSDEYAEQYLYNKPSYNNYTYQSYPPYYTYKPNFSYSGSQFNYDYSYDDYQEYIDEALEKANQAKIEASQLQQQINESLYEQACQKAYQEYQMARLNASTYGAYANSYLESARQQYESTLEMYKEMYGM